MSTCKIHHVKFYNLAPRSITCLSYEKITKKLALSRNDNSIEIWNVSHTPFLEQIIPGKPRDSIESLLWIAPHRLLSTGLRGFIIEYDLITLKPKYCQSVTGGAAWCLDVNPLHTRIAVGTEDGYVNTFAITQDNLVYEKIFDKQKGRILCLKWDNTGDMIFTGSNDTVRVWNANSGHAIHKMTTGRKQNRKETIVWCLGVTNDNHVISGDSRGVLLVWDPSMGTLIESHESHTADILSLAVSEDSNVIYSAGIDPVIRSFSKVLLKSSGRCQWVKGIERRLHIHDVRALVETNGKLYSAGVDGYLAQSSYPPKNLVKYPPLLSNPCVTICRKSRCILLRYSNYLELWRLGTSNTIDSPDRNGYVKEKNGMVYQLEEDPIKLLELRTKKNEGIISYAITKDSKMIIYSTDNHVRVFNFDIVEGDAMLTKSESDFSVGRIQMMMFSPNNKLFVTANNENGFNQVNVFKVEHKRFALKCSFNSGKQKLKNIGLMCFSPDNEFLICGDLEGRVVSYLVQECDAEEPEFWVLPSYECPATAMAVQQESNNLVIVYADHKIVEYNLSRRQYTEFSNNLQTRIPNHWLTRSFPIVNITFNPNDQNVIILHDDTTVYVVQKNRFSDGGTKIAKTVNNEEDSNSTSSSQGQYVFQVIKKYKHLVHLEWLKNGELIAVEVNPISFTEKLPPALKQKSFASS
ncbi:U3 small nucleolar RNA-associated protein 4 homolog [Diachasma alloeum]|uniref:U3 small nucleolar RNA-associated protein 4 homolog n=1 Tax=Diachasma alloeum TaxID=454923 RepID=UPI0007384EC4|nr:U3 small nucleolar RNA-associated protein 4 homolog [Diachasma alloeum]